MSALIAKRAIRYQGREYRPGDELPADDSAWVTSWVDAGSAVWAGPSDTLNPPKHTAPNAELIAEHYEELLTARGTEDADKVPEEIRPKRTRKRKSQ